MAQRTSTRTAIDILDATCRAVARAGAATVRVSDVATEAGVSTGLVHYYFTTRRELLHAAFEHADRRVQEHMAPILAELPDGLTRATEYVSSYLGDAPLFAEYRALWSEAWSGMFSDEQLRPAIVALYGRWLDRLRTLLDEARSDGSLPPGADVERLALRVTALVDGLESLQLLGFLDHSGARGIVTESLDAERRTRHSRPRRGREETPN